MLQQVQPIPFFKLRKVGRIGMGMSQLMAQPFAPYPKYTEFYCQSGGSNLNAGSDNNNAAKYTSTNGNWNQTTNVFTPTDGSNPVAAGVKPGDWMSIYLDGATVAVCSLRIAQVQNAVNGTITYGGFSGSSFIGSSPATGATGRTCKVGGAWRGPNTTSIWPLSQSFTNAVDELNNSPRLNMKNDVTYTGTGINTMSWSSAAYGSILQGYANNPGDGILSQANRATFNLNGYNPGGGGGIGNSDGCIIADIIGTGISFGDGANHIFRGSSGTQGCLFWRCTAFASPAEGFKQANTSFWCIECEAYGCMANGTTAGGGFTIVGAATLINCYSHDNTSKPGNAHGFYLGTTVNQTNLLNCIAANNTGYGFIGGMVLTGLHMWNCDAYNNTGSGLAMTSNNSGAGLNIFNSNFIKNGLYGIDISGLITTNKTSGLIANCGFGNGTMANARGKINLSRLAYMLVFGTVDYPADTTPYVSPGTGNFTLLSPYAIGGGRSYWPQSDGSHSGTVGYPDIGAAQAQGTLAAGVSTLTLRDGFVGQSYYDSAEYQSPTAATITSGSLPTGLALSQPTTSSWLISGTPTVAGTYTVTLQLASSSGTSSTIVNIVVYADPSVNAGGSTIGGL